MNLFWKINEQIMNGHCRARTALVGAGDTAACTALVGGVELYSEFWRKVPIYIPKIAFFEVGWVWVELLVKKFLHISICLDLCQQKMDIDPGTGINPRHRHRNKKTSTPGSRSIHHFEKNKQEKAQASFRCPGYRSFTTEWPDSQQLQTALQRQR